MLGVVLVVASRGLPGAALSALLLACGVCVASKAFQHVHFEIQLPLLEAGCIPEGAWRHALLLPQHHMPVSSGAFLCALLRACVVVLI
jgi:hypothetical protein